jgi:HPt (histidine-containing phosphotransfer) domain-containing protein
MPAIPPVSSLQPFDGTPPARDDTRARALSALGDDAQLFEMLMPHFCAACPDQAEALLQAARAQDASQLRHWAHTLKGTLLTVGASATAALAARIELEAREGSVADAIARCDRLLAESRLLVDQLRP